MSKIGLVILSAAALLTGCGSRGDQTSAEAKPTAAAELKDAQGGRVGIAKFTEAHDGVRVVLEITKLPPGTHGVHIHDVGVCEPPEFTSAGPHLNPFSKQHGSMNPRGPHAGDLGNIVIGADGSGTLAATSPGTKLSGAGRDSLLREGGTALVIHAAADDLKSDPAGNSGKRIACGVITR